MIFTENTKKPKCCQDKTDKLIEGLRTEIGEVDTALQEHEVEASAQFTATDNKIDAADALLQVSIDDVDSRANAADLALDDKIYWTFYNLDRQTGTNTSDIEDIKDSITTMGGNISTCNQNASYAVALAQSLQGNVNRLNGLIGSNGVVAVDNNDKVTIADLNVTNSFKLGASSFTINNVEYQIPDSIATDWIRR